MIYPKRCPICDGVLKVGSEKRICGKCIDKVEYIDEPFCKRCGKPVKDYQEYCSDCEGKAVSYRYGRAVFVYNIYIRSSISRFKYNGRKEYAFYYADCMYEKYHDWIENLLPDAIMPVPIHKKRQKERGYNQAELIALKLGEKCNVPVITDYLQRHKNTCPQKELTSAERVVNVNDAFSIDKKAVELYKNVNCVIIIDDIYTTGSTIEACSCTLAQSGVERVYYLCLSIGKSVTV